MNDRVDRRRQEPGPRVPPDRRGRATQKPKVAFENRSTIPTPTGHGVGGKGVFYIPVRQDNAGRDATPAAEIWAVNVENGEINSKTGARKRNDTAELAKYGLGNLVFQDGMVFAQSRVGARLLPATGTEASPRWTGCSPPTRTTRSACSPAANFSSTTAS